MTARRMLFGAGGGPFQAALSTIDLLAANAGGWSWFSDPRAIYLPAVNKTAFGYITGTGRPRAVAFDHATRTLSTPAELYPAGVFEIDDHDNPAFLRRLSDGKLLAGFTTHVGDPYINISTNADDPTAWAGPTNLRTAFGTTDLAGYTYSNLAQLDAEANDPIYFFTRRHLISDGAAIGHMYVSKSTNDGVSWGTATRILDMTYHKVARNGTARIDFVCSPHIDDATETTEHSIYHFYYEAGSYYRTDGTLIAAGPPFAASDLTKLYDGSGANPDAWIWDIAIDPATSRPVVTFITAPTHWTDFRYHYGRWTGSAWDVHEIVAGGTHLYPSDASNSYAGGVVLDHSDPQIVYAAVGLSSDLWEIRRYRTTDGGATWSYLVVSNPSTKSMRPVSVRDHAGELQAIWMEGPPYTTYTSYSVGTVGVGT